MEAETCGNCEQHIGHAPVYFDGRPYCCAGCVGGGPCQCTYSTPTADRTTERASERIAARPASVERHPVTAVTAVTAASSPGDPRATRPARTDRTPRSVSTSVPPSAIPPGPPSPTPMSAPRVQTPTHADVLPSREPIPFRRPSGVTVIVHIGGFPDQPTLLRFAGALEDAPELSELSLTRVTREEAWLAVRADSPQAVIEAMTALPGFSIAAEVDQNLVEARVQGPASGASIADAEEEDTSELHSTEAAPLLPQRPRFRAFRPQVEFMTEEPPPLHAAPPRPANPRPAPVAPAPAARRPAPASPAPVAPPASPAAQPSAPRSVAPFGPLTPDAPAPARPMAAPAHPAAPPSPRVEDEFVEPEERPGGAVTTVEHLTLVVYPFHSFAALNEFQGAIRRLHGVKNTRVRRFYRGTLHLAVDYEDMIPLSDRLADLKGFEFQIASESRSELEVVLQETSLAAAGDS